jgi:hypothetical protein
MSGRKDSARAALARVPYLHPAQHEDIIRELDRESLLDNPRSNGGPVHAVAAPLPAREVLTGVQAVAANPDLNTVRVQRVCAEARRLGGYQIKLDEKINVHELDAALRSSPDIEGRMRLKANLHALGMLA